MIHDLITACKGDFTAHTELRAQVNRRHSVGMLAGNLVSNARTQESDVSARVYKNGVYGFSSSAAYTPESVRAVLAAATDNANFMDHRIQKGKPALPSLPSGTVTLDGNVPVTEQKRYIDYITELDAYIAEHCPKLTSRMVVANSDCMEKLLCVSDGTDSHSEMPRAFVYLGMTAETNDGVPVELTLPFGGWGDFDHNFRQPQEMFPEVDKLYEQLMNKREGIYPDAGVKDVILAPELAGMLAHEAVGHTVEADLVLGGSVAAGRIGQRVGSDLVTMIDYAHTALGKPAPLPLYVDDEGTPAEDAILIQNGILTGYMNNRESAQHFGVKPQGNARAYLFSDEPLIRMRNTAIVPGTSKLDDMIAAIDDGYYLTMTNNGQADTTGEFMFGICMGYEIKHGKLGRAILDTTISGVAFDMLKTVDMLSDELTWACSGMCGKKQPMPVGLGGPFVKCRVSIGGR